MSEQRQPGSGLDPLVRDLVEWIAREPRMYAEVLDAWRTSCPRLTVWEDATERGLIERYVSESGTAMVRATAAGRRFVAGERRTSAAQSQPSVDA